MNLKCYDRNKKRKQNTYKKKMQKMKLIHNNIQSAMYQDKGGLQAWFMHNKKREIVGKYEIFYKIIQFFTKVSF
jgi:hypothetical protein